MWSELGEVLEGDGGLSCTLSDLISSLWTPEWSYMGENTVLRQPLFNSWGGRKRKWVTLLMMSFVKNAECQRHPRTRTLCPSANAWGTTGTAQWSTRVVTLQSQWTVISVWFHTCPQVIKQLSQQQWKLTTTTTTQNSLRIWFYCSEMFEFVFRSQWGNKAQNSRCVN